MQTIRLPSITGVFHIYLQTSVCRNVFNKSIGHQEKHSKHECFGSVVFVSSSILTILIVKNCVLFNLLNSVQNGL